MNMKNPFKSTILPYFTLLAGGLGLFLRFWLFSAVDEKGLLPSGHFADIALYILSAVVLAILFLCSRNLIRVPLNKRLSRIVSGLAYFSGSLGLLFAGILNITGTTVRLSSVAAGLCLAGCITMIIMAIRKLKGKKLHYGLCAFLTIVLMVDAVAQCQIWGTMPQLQTYFFPLLAAIFLILTAFQKTALSAGLGKRRHLVFCSQGALYFCFLSLNTQLWPFYLGMLFWSAVQLLPCIRPKKEG